MRKVLKKSSHDTVITALILAQKGKMAFKTPFVPRELTRKCHLTTIQCHPKVHHLFKLICQLCNFIRVVVKKG